MSKNPYFTINSLKKSWGVEKSGGKGNLIVDYSHTRYLKDSKDLEKQKEKALKFVGEIALKTPKLKYLKTENDGEQHNA